MDSEALTSCCRPVPVRPARGAAMRATLNAGSVETEYLRCGSGPTVIPVVMPELRETLFAALAPHCRVIMPVARTARMNESIIFKVWMRDFLEGIGTSGARLVVGDPDCAEAVDFVEEHPSQVERLVLLAAQPHTVVPPRTLPARVLGLHTASLVADAVQFLLADPPGRSPPARIVR